MGTENQYIHLVKVLYCKLSTIDKQLSTSLHRIQGLNPRPQRLEASVLPLDHHGPRSKKKDAIKMYKLKEHNNQKYFSQSGSTIQITCPVNSAFIASVPIQGAHLMSKPEGPRG